MWKTTQIESIDQDVDYARAKAIRDRAIAERLVLEAKEKRLRSILSRAYIGGRSGPDPSDDEIEEAYTELQPPNPSITIPTAFILPAAHAARKLEPRLQRTFLAARRVAQRRLHAAGLRQLRPLFDKLDRAIMAALEAQEKCKTLLVTLVELGADQHALPELPPSLGSQGQLAHEWISCKEQLGQREADLVEPDTAEVL